MMYNNLFPILLVSSFLLTVVLIVGYEYYWEYREEKAKQNHINRLAHKAVQIYGNNIPEEIENYIKELKNE